jgi:hypothetical protein
LGHEKSFTAKNAKSARKPMTLTATLTKSFEAEWADVDSMQLGVSPPSLPTADRYCLILNNGDPYRRLDLYPRTDGDCHPFDEVLVWNDLIVIGFGSRVFFVNLKSRTVKTYEMETYYCCVHPLPGNLLIASAEALRCMDSNGDLLWHNADLGIDGVTVNRVESGLIYGEGEWDPPGGWRPFVLDLRTGQPVKTQDHSQ